ncbi:protein stum homolog [Mya arenaria]|uniref:protein stum homolog n=1 Tax=Mya arenaria TaxID=6604 RepID=UPI0022E22240|nr:protein stum homolog [Mya arenaria]
MGSGDGEGRGSGDGQGRAAGVGTGRELKGKHERIAVPAMPMPMAIFTCVLNFLIPGFGTIVAGFTSFCTGCSRNEDMSIGSRCGSCWAGFGLGFLQLITTLLCLVGWIWSCVWGVFFIGMSIEYYHNNEVNPTPTCAIVSQPQILPPGAVVVHQGPPPSGYYQQGGGMVFMPPQNPGDYNEPPPAYSQEPAYPPPPPPKY